jgi:hypothetical protein
MPRASQLGYWGGDKPAADRHLIVPDGGASGVGHKRKLQLFIATSPQGVVTTL